MKKNKFYILVAVLVILSFSVAAFTIQCGAPTPATTEKVGVETTASATGETTAAATSETTAAAETTAETTAATTSATTSATTAATVSVAPTIKLSIYEGPTFSSSDSVCYYRVVATVTGSPSPTITFSKDDSNGSFGKYKVQVNLTQAAPSYTLTATAKNSAGQASDSISLTWGCPPLATEPVTTEHTENFKASNLGTVDSIGNVSTAYTAIGDTIFNSDARGYFAFDVSSLAGKDITSATVTLKNPDIPNPCNFKGNITLWYVDWLPGGLDPGDYVDIPYAAAKAFNWNEEPLKFSSDFLKNTVKDRADSSKKIEFGMAFANAATGGLPNANEGRIYTTNDIVLTVIYNE